MYLYNQLAIIFKYSYMKEYATKQKNTHRYQIISLI